LDKKTPEYEDKVSQKESYSFIVVEEDRFLVRECGKEDKIKFIESKEFDINIDERTKLLINDSRIVALNVKSKLSQDLPDQILFYDTVIQSKIMIDQKCMLSMLRIKNSYNYNGI
jgi:hypothetical protein